ncbi:MAG: hypothetical protein L0Y45_10635, partial [Woeseiaceae bacterium]|nr:hypothetical protein [Woeseiaceae bacterium]
MKKVLKYAAWTIAAIVVLALGAWAWAHQVAMDRYEKNWTVHDAGFPIPFPLSADELDALRLDAIAAGADPGNPLAGVDLETQALERAIANGRRL